MLVKLNSVKQPRNWNKLIATGHSAFDELMGIYGNSFGFRPGSVHCWSAQSGTGKSRLALTVGKKATALNPDLVYAHFSGEQNEAGLDRMTKSMGVDVSDSVLVSTEMFWPSMENEILAANVSFVVVDSWPMVEFPMDIQRKKPMDTKAKIKWVQGFAEKHGILVLLLNHTDKGGNRAGRNELLHLVDVHYTLRAASPKNYDGIRVVEMQCDKNRESIPNSRAFPFDGNWDLDTPFELKTSSGNDTGENNSSKVEIRKALQRENLIQNIQDCGGFVRKDDVESEQFVVSGLVQSGIISLLRILCDEGVVKVEKGTKVGKGQRPILGWRLVEGKDSSEVLEG
jgi:hypothetical protein